MYIFFALILFLPMLALRRREAGDTSIMDSKSTTCIKGILCIYVMLHNLGLDLDNDVLMELVCEHAGGVGVGLFFFLSAFGIVRIRQREIDTLQNCFLFTFPSFGLLQYSSTC